MPDFIEKYYSLKDLWETLSSLDKSRRYLAGGTDLLAYGEDNSRLWIDISDIKELSYIEERSKEIFIGACVKISQLEKNPLIKKWAPALSESVQYYACPSIRNLATIGGNYANASPCADGVLAMAAMDAKVILNLKGKRRVLPLLSIIKGPKKIDLKKDELVEGFLIAKKKREALFFKMMSRKRFGISKAGMCICYRRKKNVLKEVAISFSSVAPCVIRAAKTEKFLKNKIITSRLKSQLCETIKDEINPIDDIRSDADYRTDIVSVFLERALEKIFS